MDDAERIGLAVADPESLHRHINLKLAELGLPTVPPPGGGPALDAALAQLVAHHREKDRLLASYLCPADNRVQSFLYEYLQDVVVPPKLPARTLVLDRPGLARLLSLTPGKDEVASPLLKSHRLLNGVLHNPKSDRRTTAGIFHVTEGGLPVPDDKKAVPREVFAAILRRALQPPPELQRLPFTAATGEACCFVSMQLRPLVSPAVPGWLPERRMEVRLLAPGSLVANLDFVERIFGNGGDPYLPENDAALDVEGWSGHTGFIVVAPHVTGLPKKELGLPRWEDATERQRRVVVPQAFWWLSLTGSLILLSYAIQRRDSVFIAGQAFSWIPYLRNLWIHRRTKASRRPCPSCARVNPPDYRHCPDCGTAMGADGISVLAKGS